MRQIEKIWCLSDREFPEFLKKGPTFYSSSTQWPSVTIFHKSQFFLGHPVYIKYNKGQRHLLFIIYYCIGNIRNTDYLTVVHSFLGLGSHLDMI